MRPPGVVGTLTRQWPLKNCEAVWLLRLGLGSVCGLLTAVVGWIHIRARRNPPDYRFVLELPVALLLVLVGHLGGVLRGGNHP